MKSACTFLHRNLRRNWRGMIFVGFLLAVLVGEVAAQQSPIITHPRDNSTPLAMSPGAPAGSYPLSGFDDVNLFNGNLNFRLPLLQIGGRGEAGYTMTLPIESHWEVMHRAETASCNPGGCSYYHYYYPSGTPWEPIVPGYGPGVLIGRQSGKSLLDTCGSYWDRTLTRLTFIAADGTEYELRDQQTNGQPLVADPCSGQGPSRGTVFVTADGTAATFISDAIIYDYIGPNPNKRADISGYLKLRNGLIYRIQNGTVRWMKDRNGNMLKFIYDGFNQVTSITDSLNRVVTVSYASAGQPYDAISFKGTNGTTRTIYVWHALKAGDNPLSQLRQDYQAGGYQTYQALFPSILPSYSDTLYAGGTFYVDIPDGRSYRFYYNPYGELARVELPTHGAYEYDWAGGPGTDAYGVIDGTDVVTGFPEKEIYRRVIEKRIYPDEGSSVFESKIRFLKGSNAGVEAEYIDVNTRDFNNVSQGTVTHYFYGTAAPTFFIDPIGYPVWNHGREYKTETFDGALGQRVENNWQARVTYAWASADPQLRDVTTTLIETNQVSKQHFDYDTYNNATDKFEYGYGNGTPDGLIRKTHTEYLSSYASDTGIHIRNLPTLEQVYSGDDLVNPKAQTTYEYDNYTGGLLNRAYITGHGSQEPAPSHTTGYTTRGNVTQVTHWLLPASTSISTRMQYDIAGNVTSRTDPPNYAGDQQDHTTTFDFTDRFGTPDSEARGNNQYTPELSGVTTYAFATLVTTPSPFSFTSYTQFDYYTSQPVNGEDANGVVSAGYYEDLLDRPTKVISAVGTALQKQTLFTYTNLSSGGIVRTAADQTSYPDGALISEGVYDGLGRTTETRQYESISTYITTKQTYNALGKVGQVSNPYRAGDTVYWTTTLYDKLGRVSTMTTPDNAVVQTSYSGNATTVWDQAKKQRRSYTDALGRLTQVDEMYEYPSTSVYATTSYTYSALDDLVRVQQGTQNRYFMYDSLRRLLRARNPEQDANMTAADPLTGNSQWSVEYSYYNNGNLYTRTDSRVPAIVTTYSYDALNRQIKRTYSDGTPEVNYVYDAQGLTYTPTTFTRGKSVGRLVALLYGTNSTNGTYLGGYDEMGRVTVSVQRTESQDYRLEYGYNLAGEMTSEKYPSGKVVASEYDAAGRLAGVKNQATGTYWAGAAAGNAANRIQYTAHGAVSAMKLGNSGTSLWEKTTYNNRLQPTQIQLGTAASPASLLQLDYTYNTAGQSDNNGNVLTQKITISSTVINQSYGYDAVNRLTSASETGAWSQTYTYDQWGNRAVSASSGYVLSPLTPTLLSQYNVGMNRLNANLYDGAGNQTQEGSSRSFTYDGENRQLTFNGNVGQYGYDGEGQRVKKVDGSGTTVFVYNLSGQLVAEYTTVSTAGSGTSYITADHLGSTRVVTRSDGSVKARYDYLPFGEELGAGIGQRTQAMGYSPGVNQDSTRQKFTSKERDSESGLDYFEARYYSSTQGRFTSIDPYIIVLEKGKGKDESERNQILIGYIAQPQVWNRYVYVLNNPLKHTDPDGRRELTEEDRKRLNKLWAEYAKAKDNKDIDNAKELATAIMGVVTDVLGAISMVPEGEDDPASLKAVFFAIDNLGNTDYGPDGRVSNGVTATFGPGDNKCNIFVANAYAIGAGIGFGGQGVPTNSTFFGRKYPPTANDLANRSKSMANFEVVDGKPALGDIGGFPAGPHSVQGHSAIYVGSGAIIYAGPKDVKIQTVSYVMRKNEHPSVTYRRYKP
jgi:RHS repeat-associated protein